MNLKENVDLGNLPKHIAVIMDGNGRWAKQRGGLRILGHQNAIKAVRDTVEGAAELGVEYLTLYAFSTENWSRPAAEVTALMTLLVSTIRKETATLNKNNIRLQTIGNTASLPAACQRELTEAIELTKGNTRMTLVLALSYSGRWDLTQAMQRIAAEVEQGQLKADEVTERTLEERLSTSGMPDPELLIRTSGEQRISNFLLWQLAYTELYITELLWPDFRREHLYEAIISFQRRERRFGKTSEQIIK
ncbi:undecaprenyl diphosphate synthase [Pontibacter ummariensis]|uniref:Isoprenyl transferase n=1 Tax=Pontibacter ummariensis TaxID=1610492 RepID=A0A239K8G8_9BACT|nr:isoprenyl transferase [Pontibacter ummariensis]PRY06023.1 undecaprenyl diphosphate synthase [Pontibacter ummariensis]SNT13933.1 undecaprenyl diphosphate synthase [Pontibacter ummariensis]